MGGVGPRRKREKGATVGQGVGRTQKRGPEVRQKMTERGQRVHQKRSGRGRDPEVVQRRGGQRVDRKTGMKGQGAALRKEERGLHLAAPEVLTTNEKIFFCENVQNNSSNLHNILFGVTIVFCPFSSK